MKYKFLIDLPVNRLDIDKAELYIDGITDKDIKNRKTESVHVCNQMKTRNKIYIEKNYKLFNFLPKSIQNLLRMSVLSFFNY